MSALRLLGKVSDKAFVFVLVTALVTVCVVDGKDYTTTEDRGERSDVWCRMGECMNNKNMSQNDQNDCSINDDCLTFHVCCKNKCVESRGDCLEQTCTSDTDCQRNETCCTGFCKPGKNSSCADRKSGINPDVALIIMLCLMFISFLFFCYCGCREKILHNRLYSSLRSTEATVSTSLSRSLEFPSNQRFNTNGPSIPSRKLKVHFYVPRIYNPPPVRSKKQDKAFKPAPRTWYGATCETV